MGIPQFSAPLIQQSKAATQHTMHSKTTAVHGWLAQAAAASPAARTATVPGASTVMAAATVAVDSIMNQLHGLVQGTTHLVQAGSSFGLKHGYGISPLTMPSMNI
jgi:hypothetical protein